MNRLLIGFATMFAASCSAPVAETTLISPEIPDALLKPVNVPTRPVDTLADIGLVLTDHVEALGQANGQLCAIGEIVTKPCKEPAE